MTTRIPMNVKTYPLSTASNLNFSTSNIGNKFPVRILYPDIEVTRNPNTPPQKTVTDKLWWDVNTTGQN